MTTTDATITRHDDALRPAGTPADFYSRPRDRDADAALDDALLATLGAPATDPTPTHADDADNAPAVTPNETPGRRGRRAPQPRSDAKFDAFTRRIVRAYGRRAARADFDTLAALTQLADVVDAATTDAVRELRAVGFSWTDIGNGLGIDRRYAWRRYAAKIGE